ncbi:MAG TPA: methionine--tRNA ligase, partial [Patescibacteria group bacterium]
MAKKYYITTAIDYVNGAPHIGHAAEKVQADALARWRRLRGDEVFFLTGTDENTMKLIKAADKERLEPQELADKYAGQFRAMSDGLDVSYDRFIRTSDKRAHHPGAQRVWQLLDKNGYIYKGKYEGLYCLECEQFYTEKEVVDGKCPEHGILLEKRSEENYLFKLSAFTDQIRDLIVSGKLQIAPETRKNEILSFLDEGLKDVSFSRPADKLTMGVPVPGDDSQRMYVWCDALTNYITGVGYGTDETEFKKWWPADLHVIGKGILRFHAAIWPAMLLGAGIEVPRGVFVHSYFTLEGKKISKSKGNVIAPSDLTDRHGVDAIRYYLLRALPYVEDGDYSERHFKEIYDAELANDLGNLASRVLTLIEKKCSGKVPAGKADPKLKEHVGQAHHEVANL